LRGARASDVADKKARESAVGNDEGDREHR
jgi:hypothetical protein